MKPPNLPSDAIDIRWRSEYRKIEIDCPDAYMNIKLEYMLWTIISLLCKLIYK